MNQKKTKGFTLIELLAVIVILAIIALIAVPVTLNIIDKANKSAFKATAYGIISAGEYYWSSQQLEPQGMLEDVTFDLSDERLELKGDIPEGNIVVTQDGDIALAVHNNRYCVTKGLDDTDVTITEDVENCKIPNGEQNPSINDSITTYGSAKSSSGNGYSLYNGIKLLNIDTIWDKETYPYCIIFALDHIPGAYNIAFTSTKYVADEQGIHLTDTTNFVEYIFYSTTYSLHRGPDILESGDGWSSTKFIWANYDVYNNANQSIYLAASNPISLEGMTVVEWDGNIDGLTAISSSQYVIASYTTSASSGIFSMYNGDEIEIGSNFSIKDNGWSITSNYGVLGAQTIFLENTNVLAAVSDTETGTYTSLIAYRP